MIQNWCCHKNDIDTFNVRILNFRCQAISSSAELELALWVCKVICSMQILCKMLLLTNLQLVCKSCRTISAYKDSHTTHNTPTDHQSIGRFGKKITIHRKMQRKVQPRHCRFLIVIWLFFRINNNRPYQYDVNVDIRDQYPLLCYRSPLL